MACIPVEAQGFVLNVRQNLCIYNETTEMFEWELDCPIELPFDG